MKFKFKKSIKRSINPKYLSVVFCSSNDRDRKWKILRCDMEGYYYTSFVDYGFQHLNKEDSTYKYTEQDIAVYIAEGLWDYFGTQNV